MVNVESKKDKIDKISYVSTEFVIAFSFQTKTLIRPLVFHS